MQGEAENLGERHARTERQMFSDKVEGIKPELLRFSLGYMRNFEGLNTEREGSAD